MARPCRYPPMMIIMVIFEMMIFIKMWWWFVKKVRPCRYPPSNASLRLQLSSALKCWLWMTVLVFFVFLSFSSRFLCLSCPATNPFRLQQSSALKYLLSARSLVELQVCVYLFQNICYLILIRLNSCMHESKNAKADTQILPVRNWFQQSAPALRSKGRMSSQKLSLYGFWNFWPTFAKSAHFQVPNNGNLSAQI